MIKLVFLWSDILLWLACLLIFIGFYFTLKSKDQKQKWTRVFAQPVSVVAVIILIFYMAIALLDSVHFKLGNDINPHSLLDKILVIPLNASERTYSKPLAYQDFSQSYLADGSRGYAHLSHIDAKINSADAHHKNLMSITYQALLWWLLCLFVFFIAWYRLRHRYKRSAVLVAGLITVAILLLLCIWIALMIPNYHLLGTDRAGIDVFYKAIKAIRTSLIFGLISTLISLPIAISLGLMAGYFKGVVDDVIQFIYTTINAVPSILLIAALVVMVQVYMTQNVDLFETTLARSDAKLLLLCLVIALTSWTGLCRLIRAETLKLSQLEFVQAAKIFGLSDVKVLLRHLLPNVMHLVLITIVLEFSALVLTESVLSYIGIGVDSATHSWGNMINGARLELAKTPIVWWSLSAAFVLMFVLVLSVNLLADQVREVFDPRGKS